MSRERERLIVMAASKPSLQRHAKMRHDAARNRWVILAPERVFEPNEIAAAVLRLCDGSRTVEAIAGELAQSYTADSGEIMGDILPMLQELTDKGLVKT